VRALDLLGFSVRALRGHRLRTALSLLGVAIGVAAVVTLTALGEGARRYVLGQFAAVGTNMVIVLPGKTQTTGAMPGMGGVPNDVTLDDALAVARVNAARHGASIEFVESDWFAALADRRFDLIVANPPYVAAGDAHLAAAALRFEPRGALVAGPLGLECIEVIVERARYRLTPGGRLLFEHGYDQGPRARALLAAAGYDDIATRLDLAGIERVSGGRV